jgi:malate dehydrogenase (oxaloacetate-decarboxylating)
MDYKKQALKLHKKHRGKIEITSKVPLKNKNDLSTAYTPGVAEVCKIIHADVQNMLMPILLEVIP